MTKSGYVLAIDGGGTKTEAVVADIHGRLLGRGAPSGKVNLHEDGITEEEIQQHFHRAIATALKSAHLGKTVSFENVVVGMAGIDSTRDVTLARRIIHRAWPRLPKRMSIVNDVVIARRAGSDTPYGIALIAGTGSNGYGVSRNGRDAWVSGIGHYASDDGSAYDIGRRVLRAVAKSADGRGPRTALEQRVLKFYGIESIREIEWPLHHQGQNTKSEIAKLAPLADAAARARDTVARRILADVADELVLMALALVKRLGLANIPCDCVCAGGVFLHNTIIWNRFRTTMKRAAPRLRCIRLTEKPVMGALKIALE